MESRPPQRTFHPAKAQALDGIPASEAIETVGISWREPDGKRHSSVFVWPEDAEYLAVILERACASGAWLEGLNLPFDVMFLRRAPQLMGLLEPETVRLCELAVRNFQASDVRTEHGLKAIARLERVYDYSRELDLRAGARYRDRFDPRLHHYNCIDAEAGGVIGERLCESIGRNYPSRLKLGAYANQFYSDLTWTVILMSEWGICFDRERLNALRTRTKRRIARYADLALARHGIKVAGTGSKSSIQSLVNLSSEYAKLLDDPRLEKTTRRGDISTKEANLNLICHSLAVGTPQRTAMRYLLKYREQAKLESSYLRTLLEGSRAKRKKDWPESGGLDRNPALIGDLAYPQWYLVPQGSADDTEGGTQQGRLAAKAFAAQTPPKPIKRCMKSRYPGGFLWELDYKGLEWLVAALLSGDPLMMTEILDGIDPHSAAALEMFGSQVRNRPDWDKFRQAGKRRNFLALYRGGWKALQLNVRKDANIEMSESDCRRSVAQVPRKYPILWGWQDDLIAKAKRQGYLEAPLIGDTRTFLGSARGIDETYTSTICNFLVQWTAARITQSAHWELIKAARKAKARVVFPCQTHDSILADGARGTENWLDETLGKCLTSPGFYGKLCKEIGRTLPLTTEKKVLFSGDSRNVAA